jgi:hypothetical protein
MQCQMTICISILPRDMLCTNSCKCDIQGTFRSHDCFAHTTVVGSWILVSTPVRYYRLSCLALSTCNANVDSVLPAEDAPGLPSSMIKFRMASLVAELNFLTHQVAVAGSAYRTIPATIIADSSYWCRPCFYRLLVYWMTNIHTVSVKVGRHRKMCLESGSCRLQGACPV